jgi:SsrA-binding protein
MATTITDNKKSLFDFFIEEKIEAGIVLKGWEVKSLRANRGNIKESYAILRRKEVYLIGAHFSPLPNANIKDEDEVTRTRKLLLNRKEITKIINFIQQKGYTLIPLSLYWKRGNVKVQIGLAKGRKKQDKRALIKERDWKLDKERLSKQRYNT